MSRRGTLRSGVQSKAMATAGLGFTASLMAREFYRIVVAAVAGSLLFGCLPAVERPPVPVRIEESRRLMGMPWTITVHAASQAAAEAAVRAAFAEVERLETLLSDYEPQSELSRLSAAAPTAGPVPVSDDLWRVLERAVAIRDATDGSFDPTVGPLTTLWRQARRSGRLPQPEKLAAALACVGPSTLALDAATRGVSLARPGMRLDLGGIGVGYAVDRALAVLTTHGITAAMVDASGDIAVSAPPPGTAGWRIAMSPLAADGPAAATITLAHAAITTSGDAFQAVEIDGRRYSHIVDPRTGLGVPGPAAVTVIAPDCTTADALATAASVQGPERGLALFARFPRTSGRFLWQDGGRQRTAESRAWPTP